MSCMMSEQTDKLKNWCEENGGTPWEQDHGVECRFDDQVIDYHDIPGHVEEVEYNIYDADAYVTLRTPEFDFKDEGTLVIKGYNKDSFVRISP